MARSHANWKAPYSQLCAELWVNARDQDQTAFHPLLFDLKKIAFAL